MPPCSHAALKISSRYIFSSRSVTLKQDPTVLVSDTTQEYILAPFETSPYAYHQIMDGETKQNSTKSTSSWVQKIAEDTAKDKREQPWKELLGETHDKGAEGEDWINLQLPNHVQCGSMAA